MSRPRDSQRSKFFAATHVLDDFNTPMGVQEITQLLSKLANSAYLARRYPEIANRSIQVKIGGRMDADRYKIVVPKTVPVSRREVVHYFARLVFYRRDPYAEQAWYGWEYAAIYRDVAHVAFSPAVAELLTSAYSARRVRSAKKITREVTPEMLERLRRAREKRLSA